MTFQEKFDQFLNRFRRVSLTEKIHFTSNLQVMTRAGLSLSQGLKTLIAQTDNKKLKSILTDVQEAVEKGQPLADGLSRYPDTFSELYINMVRAGERSGKLEDILKELAIQMRKTREITAKIRGALMYPVFIIIATVGIGTFIFVYVLPKVIGVFEELEATLPWTTRALIWISNFITEYGWFVLIGLVVLVILFLRTIATKKGRFILHKTLLKLPLVGLVLKKIDLAKFSRTFSALLGTDIPIVETLKLTSNVLSNVCYRLVVVGAAEEVEKGVPVSGVLAKEPELFPPIVTQMMAVGEETGTLDSILKDITEFYEEDVGRTMANLSTIIEPILIVILGIAVAGIAMAVVMPMYSLTQQI